MSESDLDWLASIGADDDVIEAHQAGVRKLSGGEGDDFGRERHEDRMRLFDDDLE